MQVIIPMSGFGERFRKAGYTVPKPLIEVDGKPIIEHITEMFSPTDDFIFICNGDHLRNTDYKMREILTRIAPDGVIHSIDPHKLGPIHAVMQIINFIDKDKATVVNYADFTCDWDYSHFCKEMRESDCDGSIPAYRGFHPHTLWSNYYAYLKEDNLKVLDIQEKTPFTDKPTEEFASSGTYYFKNAYLMEQYFKKCIKQHLMVGGEYYVSMAYKPMIDDGLNIEIYELNHFMQWGTPLDLEEYQYWSGIFSSMIKKRDYPRHNGTRMMPIVGQGSRFIKEGFVVPKPMIEVSKDYMAVKALQHLPRTERTRVVLRDDMEEKDLLVKRLKDSDKNTDFIFLNKMTDGQASTCYQAISDLSKDEPLTIAACDNGMVYDKNLFDELYNDSSVDIIVWTARGYPGAIRNPQAYGWVEIDELKHIRKVSVKEPLSNPKSDPVVTGTFTFKKTRDFISCVDRMKDREGKINNEYYIDNAINDALELGLKCSIFEVEYFICWGTPNDLKTFEYWQKCFDEWQYHQYDKKQEHT